MYLKLIDTNVFMIKSTYNTKKAVKFVHNYQRLKDCREDNDLTQAEVSEIIGTYQTHYSKYERGEREMPMHLFIILAKYYNVSLDYLAGLTNDKRKFW